MSYPIFAPSDTWYSQGGTTVLKSSITEIEFVDSYTPTGSEGSSWDASAALDGSIMVYITGTKLTIAGNGSGGFYANPDSSYFLSDSNATNWFTSVNKITNLALLDTSKVTSMNHMFYGMHLMTTLDVGHFDTSNVVDMGWMFAAFPNITGSTMSLTSLDVSNWDTSKVETIRAMFQACIVLKDLDVSGWTMSSCKNISYAFNGCRVITTLDVSNWDVSNVEGMSSLFSGCYVMPTLDVSKWDIRKCKDFSATFANCYALTSVDVSNWDVSGVEDMGSLFAYCKALTALDLSKWELLSCTNMKSMFNGCISLVQISGIENLDVGNVENMASLFYNCTSLSTLDLSKWDTSSCTDMSSMFYNCISLTSLDLSKWDVSKVVTFAGMFAAKANADGHGSNGTLESLDVTGWDISSCKYLDSMFGGQGKLTSLAVDTWTGANAIENMGWMFWGCESLKSVDLSNFDTKNVVSFHHLFAHDVCLTEIKGIENWDIGNAVTLNAMFHATHIKTLDISKWNTSKVEDMSQFLQFCNQLTHIIGLEKIDTSQLKACGEMLSDCRSLKEVNLSNFNTTGVSASWIDPYRGQPGMGMKAFFTSNDRLERIILGENFSFNGDGTCSPAAVFPTPNSVYIPNTKGRWYNENTFDSYYPSDIPSRTAGTYVCVPIDVIVKHTTLVDLGETARKITGTADKIVPSEAVAVISDAIDNNQMYDAGFAAGLEHGSVFQYATNLKLDAIFSRVVFPENYDMVLKIPSFGDKTYQTFAYAENLRSIKIITDDTEGSVSFNQVFRECKHLEVVDLTECSRKIVKSDYAFYQASKVVSILGALDLSQITDTANYAFFCSSLKDIEFVPNTIVKSIRLNSAYLTEASIESTIEGLADLTGSTAQTLTLNGVGRNLTEAQTARITAKNWTLAY